MGNCSVRKQTKQAGGLSRSAFKTEEEREGQTGIQGRVLSALVSPRILKKRFSKASIRRSKVSSLRTWWW